jgi:small subunit ribosomal protein S4
MGDTRKPRKKYKNPRKRWVKERILEEQKIMETYGLKNKKEIRQTEAVLRKKRATAKKLLALPEEERTKEEQKILQSLIRTGILPPTSTLADILGLTLTTFLERRLQTKVWRNGMANTPKQARQIIVHGHITIKGTKNTSPAHTVTKEEENTINWKKGPLILAPPQKETKTKETKTSELKKKFEEAKPQENKTEDKKEPPKTETKTEDKPETKKTEEKKEPTKKENKTEDKEETKTEDKKEPTKTENKKEPEKVKEK